MFVTIVLLILSTIIGISKHGVKKGLLDLAILLCMGTAFLICLFSLEVGIPLLIVTFIVCLRKEAAYRKSQKKKKWWKLWDDSDDCDDAPTVGW